MSCIKCDEFQNSDRTSYYRWKNANVEVRACEDNLKEVFNALNEAQEDHAN